MPRPGRALRWTVSAARRGRRIGGTNNMAMRRNQVIMFSEMSN